MGGRTEWRKEEGKKETKVRKKERKKQKGEMKEEGKKGGKRKERNFLRTLSMLFLHVDCLSSEIGTSSRPCITILLFQYTIITENLYY